MERGPAAGAVAVHGDGGGGGVGVHGAHSALRLSAGPHELRRPHRPLPAHALPAPPHAGVREGQPVQLRLQSRAVRSLPPLLPKSHLLARQGRAQVPVLQATATRYHSLTGPS